jgi:hypothetical protein
MREERSKAPDYASLHPGYVSYSMQLSFEPRCCAIHEFAS